MIRSTDVTSWRAARPAEMHHVDLCGWPSPFRGGSCRLVVTHLRHERVELPDLPLDAQPRPVRPEKVRVLLLQLLPHCGRAPKLVSAAAARREKNRWLPTEVGETGLDVRLHLQGGHNLLLRHVELEASFDELLHLHYLQQRP